MGRVIVSMVAACVILIVELCFYTDIDFNYSGRWFQARSIGNFVGWQSAADIIK